MEMCALKKKKRKEKKLQPVSGHGSEFVLCNEQTISPKNPSKTGSEPGRVI